ncbi:heterokaryon incompatibility protein-domain-containing protein [Boeremia exigua]|uniref:heterokaryon incompatibility protein-domain-containing protein n=1 Tax=Boeremia exigua TaxID=749465 RepID=UPI001E8D6043|nr:heterokaryon incompatibility protein-domain-containing protein [Boeremia exigua]KAH6615333.1 heterokaryon incompatibility protein-domain-containing protein [Boeremia exigua]
MHLTNQNKDCEIKVTSAGQLKPASTYQTLNTARAEIRLLCIQPALLPTQPICCSLSVTSFDVDDTDDQRLDYEALSYVWGKDYQDTPIYVDDQPRTVTVNLYQALKHLRHSHQAKIVWIDALCIDQGNLVERTHQVPLMRRIYAGATKTILWLGPDIREEYSLAMDYLECLGSDETLHFIPGLGPYAEVEGKSILSPAVLDAVELFFRDPWWSRVWTVQEWLKSQHAVFQHGHRQIDNRAVRRAILHYSIHVANASCCKEFLNSPESRRVLSFIQPLVRTDGADKTRSLVYILSHFRNTRNATDPRDKIYGMLGLACDRYEHAITVDYTQPIEMVLENATFQIIKATCWLEILSHVGIGGENIGIETEVVHNATAEETGLQLDLPSFVPNYTSIYEDKAFSSRMARLRVLRLYKACRDVWAVDIASAPGSLRLKGIFVDEVLDICEPSIPSGPVPSAVGSHFDFDPVTYLQELLSMLGLHNSNKTEISRFQDVDIWLALTASIHMLLESKESKTPTWYRLTPDGTEILELTKKIKGVDSRRK